jgi:hypothetical protein
MEDERERWISGLKRIRGKDAYRVRLIADWRERYKVGSKNRG